MKFFKNVMIVVVGLVIMALAACAPEPEKKVVYVTQNGNSVPVTGFTETFQQIYQDNIRSVPRIELFQCALYSGGCGYVGGGSGFVVAEDTVVTNYHVAVDYFQPDYTYYPQEIYYYKLYAHYPATNALNNNYFINELYEVQAVYGMPDNDLAILKVETLGRPPVKLFSPGKAGLAVIDPVMAVGYPLDYTFVPFLGEINSLFYNKDMDWKYWVSDPTAIMMTSCLIDAGNSGGPLFNETGEVIGINFAVDSWYSPHGMALIVDPLLGLNFKNLAYEHRDPPDPSNWSGHVLVEQSFTLNTGGDSRSFTLTLNSGHVYTFESQGISLAGGLPISTNLNLTDSYNYWYGNTDPLNYLYTSLALGVSDGLWSVAQSGTYYLDVWVNTTYTDYGGGVYLRVTEYDPN